MRNGANRAEPNNRRSDSPLPKRIINVPILKFKRKCKSDKNLSKKRNGSFSSALYPGREAPLPVRATVRAARRGSLFALPRGRAVTAPVGRLPLRLLNDEAALAARRQSAEGGKPPPIGGGRLNQDTATPATAAATRPVRATARAARRGSLFALPRGRAVTAPVGR